MGKKRMDIRQEYKWPLKFVDLYVFANFLKNYKKKE